MKSLILWKKLAMDYGQRCAVDTSRDYDTVARRTEHEGMEFFTITLPAFGKAFERWLALEQVDPTLATGFRCKGGLPVFLRGFLDLVFNPDGSIRDDASPDAVLAVRHLSGVAGKMYLPASAERTHRAMLGYLETDSELEEVDAKLASEPAMVLALRRIFTLLFHRVLDSGDLAIATGELTPKHGPGATADGLHGNQKFAMSWTWRLEEFFKADEFLLPSPRYHQLLDSVQFHTLEQELPVKVIHVPKTQKTPRLIAKEPTCMQFAQQAVSGVLTKRINEDSILKRLVGFREQEPNQVLAREGSITGTLATLDLSEASDRVSNYLVRSLFGPWTHLDGAIQACRSRRAEVRMDDGSVVIRDLTKFASMGSALTFPVEAMVFLAIVFYGIERDLGRPLRERDVKSLCGSVRVYGDDIIVPVDHVRSVTHSLESFGFRVNAAKSFWTGLFRESCGKDYFKGIDVSYVKLRKPFPADRRDVLEVVSLVSFFNQVKENHLPHTTDWLRKELVDLLGFFPRVSGDSEILGEVDAVTHDIDGLCKKTHNPLAKGWVIRTQSPENPLDGERALLKFFLKQGVKPMSRGHLVRSGRSSGVSIILRKAAV